MLFVELRNWVYMALLHVAVPPFLYSVSSVFLQGGFGCCSSLQDSITVAERVLGRLLSPCSKCRRTESWQVGQKEEKQGELKYKLKIMSFSQCAEMWMLKRHCLYSRIVRKKICYVILHPSPGRPLTWEGRAAIVDCPAQQHIPAVHDIQETSFLSRVFLGAKRRSLSMAWVHAFILAWLLSSFPQINILAAVVSHVSLNSSWQQ